jgi:hypothetical protein
VKANSYSGSTTAGELKLQGVLEMAGVLKAAAKKQV